LGVKKRRIERQEKFTHKQEEAHAHAQEEHRTRRKTMRIS
jgi:hypothetical protein